MAKFQIIIEDNEEIGGVNISVHGGQGGQTRAAQLTSVMIQQARLIARIPLPDALQAGAPCSCDKCQAMAEKIALNPTIH
ncbi:hypothetical protein SAMN05216588_12628 [Pseudomonas flavescens]|uniref:Uncharacterized protein n=1 Tax=Phytopseudomonas flavescens TaxID=29435 RepID=A0A1G8NX64_9GAMM|nr:hypothetical protein [Pseudomonas flavescens]SDI84110.1 hypothetical protein SAMN05216588_12628 [Pseudomonas flavescens]